VKTSTLRYPVKAVSEECGTASGDWALMTTEVTLPTEPKLKMGALAHLRGPEVHTFLFTAGVTTMGSPQQHKDDDLDADTGFLVYRKCPRSAPRCVDRGCKGTHSHSSPDPLVLSQVCNDGTKAQPKIDRTNKYRQFRLKIERRRRTECFPFRSIQHHIRDRDHRHLLPAHIP
jgi:hypothetical protein